jgi:hypothetical protein
MAEETRDTARDTYRALGSVDLYNSCVTVFFHSDLPTDTDIDTMVSAIAERIDSGKKPAGVLKKELDRIVLHKAMLDDALTKFLNSYTRMVTPQSRMSPAQKARLSMLEQMPVKMLKEYAGIYIPDEVGDFILPDDKEALINRLCEYLTDTKEEVSA